MALHLGLLGTCGSVADIFTAFLSEPFLCGHKFQTRTWQKAYPHLFFSGILTLIGMANNDYHIKKGKYLQTVSNTVLIFLKMWNPKDIFIFLGVIFWVLRFHWLV